MKKVLAAALMILCAIVGTAHATLMDGTFTTGGSLTFNGTTLDFSDANWFNFYVNVATGDFASLLVTTDLVSAGDVTSNPHGAINDWATIYNSTKTTSKMVIDIMPGNWTFNAGGGSGVVFWLEIPVTFVDLTGSFDATPGLMSISGNGTLSGGYYSGSMSGSFVTIPEPATMALLALGGLAALRRKQHSL